MTQGSKQTFKLELRTSSYRRSDSLVEAQLDNAQLRQLFDEKGQDYFSLQRAGEALPKTFQLEADGDELKLYLVLEGEVDANSSFAYELVSDGGGTTGYPPVSVKERPDYQGQDSFEISTPAATYIYHKQGAGFASMIDTDGHDWLSYRPHGGSDGKYRGIPNLVYPEGYFHPGGTECKSEVTKQGPLKAEIYSETKDGNWACKWEVFPHFARLTVLKAPKAYWFLYEGTPGGELDEANDFCVRSGGERSPASERWDAPLPEPRWVYFGAGNAERVLYLHHHEAGQGTDSYWPMENNMTVFGFGRLKLESYLTSAPAQFTVGFLETQNAEQVQGFLRTLGAPISCDISIT